MLARTLIPLPDPATWQRIATCQTDLSHLDPDHRPAVRSHAWTMLRQARARRLGIDADAIATDGTGAAVTFLPRSAFQAGPARLRRAKARITILPPAGPGDAA